MMKRLALTGPTGCGKGYVGEIIGNKYSYPVLDTDALVHRLYNEDETLRILLTDYFGSDILTNGKIDRKKIGKIVFADREKLDYLNKIVHSVVRKYCIAWMNERQKEGYAACFVDAPQLFEAKMENIFDGIICVVAPVVTRLERIMLRDGLTETDAEKRMSNQLTDDEYIRRSNYKIFNSGDDDIFSQIKDIFDEIGI